MLGSNEHRRLRQRVAQTLPVARPEFIGQVERVLVSLLDADPQECAKVETREDIVAAFRREKYLPDALADALDFVGAPNTAADAVCLAASLYPDRRGAGRMSDTRLRQRARLFRWVCRSRSPLLELLKQRLGRLSARKRSCGQVCQEMARCAADPGALLADIAATDAVAIDQSKADRRDGAILYLLTCPSKTIVEIVTNWLDDRMLVRFLRNQLLQVPPIAADCMSDGRRPASAKKPASVCPSASRCVGLCRNRDLLAAILRRRLAVDDEEALQHALLLFFKACGEACEYLRADRVLAATEEFWEDMLDKLMCGFPYYSFGVHFAYWWRLWLEHYHWYQGPRGREDDEDLSRQDDEDADLQREDESDRDLALLVEDYSWVLTPGALHDYSEGYRFVRTTFFWGQDPLAADVQPTAQERAEKTAHLRMAIDELWFDLFAQTNRREDIMREYDVGRDWVDVTCFRLRQRMRAYHLARFEGLSNEQILGAKQSVWNKRRRRYVPEDLFAGGVGTIKMITSLARPVPTGHTFLPAFTSQVLLRSTRVDLHPAHRDPWDLTRYLEELWWWLPDKELDHRVAKGAPHSHSHKQAQLLSVQRRVLVAINRLRQIPPADSHRETCRRIRQGVVELLGKHRTRCARCEDYANKTLLAILEFADWACCSQQEFREWLRIANMCWIVPAWYLIHVERLTVHKAIEWLRPDPAELADVEKLLTAM